MSPLDARLCARMFAFPRAGHILSTFCPLDTNRYKDGQGSGLHPGLPRLRHSGRQR